MDRLRTKYWLNTVHLDETFIKIAAKKIGKNEENMRRLVNTIVAIRAKDSISSEELMDLNDQIEKINLPG